MPSTIAFTGKCSRAEVGDSRLPPLLVFADDWGRHPSSCQHLVRNLLGRFEVCWVNTIGTRGPGLNLATLARGLEKIRGWFRPGTPSQPLPAHLSVLNPKMWPWFSRRFDRGLNRELLLRQLAPLVRSMPTAPVALTTIPIVADLIGLLPVRRWVYYCVDDFGEWPGLDQVALRQMEERLIRRADTLVAVSETLEEKLAQRGRTSRLLTHGVELDFWRTPAGPISLPLLNDLEPPFIVFWGVIDRRMDVAFLRRLDKELTRGTIVLVGPEADPDPALYSLRRVAHIPPVSFEQLPQLARAAHALIMPYADLPVTRAMQPLKLKEYLATGKPVIVRDLPATRSWSDCLDLVDNPAAFAGMVRRRVENGLPAEQGRARSRLAGESWSEKARQLEQWALFP
jgi:glycosyltransferase involved in cell wall biosynthesis